MTQAAVLTLTDFLLARIARDEVDVRDGDPLPRGAVFDHDVTGWWDCARVLAECEAKRQIVEMFRSLDEGDGGFFFGVEACLTRLALPYADHPDYREEWRP